MKRIGGLIVVAMALSTVAVAQSDDAAYCRELGNLALRYTGTAGGDGRLSPSLDTIEAIAECSKGNYAKGIPVLEKTLRDNRFTLPKR
ncbi:MAG: hypothetical protein KIT25_04105 [Enhydrobacter sp.]|nr:MAG: hypothetical protein KIT25_04105 [Enhydrobacter sp.]